MTLEIEVIPSSLMSSTDQVSLTLALAMGVPELSAQEYRLLQFYVVTLLQNQGNGYVISLSPGIVSAHTGLSVSIIRRARRRLIALGWLEQVGRTAVGLRPAVERMRELHAVGSSLREAAQRSIARQLPNHRKRPAGPATMEWDSDLVPMPS